MKPRTMVLMVVAVGCGLAASYMTSKLLADRKEKEKPPEERVNILYVKAKVPRFTVIKEPEKYFEQRSRLKSEAPKSYFSEFSEIKDKKINKELKVDVHVSPEDISDKGIAELDIPPGMGAISIRTPNQSFLVGGFIKAKDKVDVILTIKGQLAASQTILRDVMVLAVGDNPHGVEDGTGPVSKIATNVTLALGSEEAQLITLAQTLGDLSLFLRKDGEGSTTSSTKVMKPADLIRFARGISGTKVDDENLPPDLKLPPEITKPDDKK